MDNYKVLQRLGKGAQGSVFLVEDKETGQKLVLKKVECSDEAQANKAFKEAVALEKLKHQYICGYREFFILWDSQDCAIFVCIVMDFYKMGDLDMVLKAKREKGIALEELVLKKWIGQLLEALHYMHSQETIHRDLKPSNVFLKDDMSITIGDFGVATVMGNIRTITRTTVGSMSWVAPEILDMDSKYDERSDIWSLGCVIIEMATCSFMDSAQISVVLYQIKDDPNILEDILTEVSSQYSPQLTKLIRMCLIRAFEQRPSSEDLVKLPYPQECLGLSSSHLYKGGASKGGEGPVESVPEGSGVGEVMQYLQTHSENEKGVELGLTALLTLSSKQDGCLGDDVKRGLLSVMRDFPSSLTVQSLSCQILESIAVTVGEGDLIFSTECVKTVLQAMRRHSESIELQRSALSLVTTLSTDEETAVCLGAEGGIQDVLAIMRGLSNQSTIVASCCTALWSLSIIDANLEILTKEKAVADVCKALQSYGGDSNLVDSACSALWSLSMNDANLDIMLDFGIVDLLLKTVILFIENPVIVKFAVAALSSLAQVHEISAYHIVRTEEGVDGLPVLIKALRQHSDNLEVVETLACLFHDLTEYGEVKEELRSLKVWEHLSEVESKCYPIKADEATLALTEAMAALTTGSSRPSSAAQKRAGSAKQRTK
ncbi:serine/threonine kinase-like domain-containing protein STKLD1 [Halichondria panicea]|uniref:serine/threonine kinase-like domain-containing protein STKLD1 n=1 Tax=Halichondria panicea TaxID=6063 RepID=UPI00312BBB2F